MVCRKRVFSRARIHKLSSRARKIRCDSTRPVCNNCVRRSNECQYDAAPKRRGPDKRPGTRQRSCKKRPADGSAPPPPSKRKRSSTTQAGDNGTPTAGVKENMASMKTTFPSSSRPSGLVDDGRGPGHMHVTRVSPSSLDLKPVRGIEGQGMFAVGISCIVLCYRNLFLLLSHADFDVANLSSRPYLPLRPRFFIQIFQTSRRQHSSSRITRRSR